MQTIDALHNASQTLLCMTDFMGNPNLNGILTIIAMKQYYFVRNQGGHYYALHVTVSRTLTSAMQILLCLAGTAIFLALCVITRLGCRSRTTSPFTSSRLNGR